MFRPSLFVLAVIGSTSLLAQAKTAPNSIPRATVVANAEAEFTKVDADKNGQMSRAEIEAFQTAANVARVTARTTEVFAQLDGDKNGQLSPAEFAKVNPAPKADASAVLRIDSNKDGQVSLTEHRAATIETFGKLDTNKDGILTAEEVRIATTPPKK